MSATPATTYLVDVDDTLIDTATVKAEMDHRLLELLGDDGRAHWWATYEAVRDEAGVVDIGRTLARFGAGESRGIRIAIADIFLRFPFAAHLHANAIEVLTHLRDRGAVAIFSDGDPTYQTPKIIRSGLASAVEGFVFVYRDKVAHLAEVFAALPADRYVVIDDKPKVLSRVRADHRETVTTVLVRQGRYAADLPDGRWSGADVTVAAIGDLLHCDV